MGGDGGSIPGRDVLAKTKKAAKTAEQVTFGESKILNWTHCSLTKQILCTPICCDNLGNLYNKQSLIEHMINKTLPKQLSYIKKIKKDIINCNITFINLNKGIFKCPISGLIANGKYKFVCLRKCGCIISQRALNNIKGKNCLICNKELNKNINNYTRIPINASNEIKEMLFKMNLQRKKLKKLKKNNNKNNDNDIKEEINDNKNHKLDKKKKKKKLKKC